MDSRYDSWLDRLQDEYYRDEEYGEEDEPKEVDRYFDDDCDDDIADYVYDPLKNK